MSKQLTITVDEEVYEGLEHFAGPGGLDEFVGSVLKQYVIRQKLDEAYFRMLVEDEEREADELERGQTYVGAYVRR